MRYVYRVAILLCIGASTQVNAQEYKGNIDVLLKNPGYVQLNPGISLMPGETASFKVTGEVDVNHEHYEVRRCKYFGLKCWYEKRSVPHMQPAKAFEVILWLKSEDGQFERTFKKDANSDSAISVSYPDTIDLSTAAELTGILNFAGMNRTPCSGRPRYCSAGTLKITASTATTNVRKRQAKIRAALRDNIRGLDPILVRSDVFIDPLLVDSSNRRKELQGIFRDELNSVVFGNNQQFARQFVEIAKFAVGLDSDQAQVTSLNNKILEAYVALGDWSRITDEGGKSLITARNGCTLSDPPQNTGDTSSGCQDYSKMLKLNAIGWLEQKARYSSTEIRVALGMLEQATAAINAEALFDQQNCKASIEACKLAANFYVDGARMLTILRTTPELEKAEQWLAKALEMHRTIAAAE